MKKFLILIVALAVAVSAWGQFTLPSGTTSTGTTSTGSTTSQSALGGQSTQGIDTTQLLQAAGASSSTSQKTSLSVTVPESQVRAQLAMSTPDYPVTPGDVYALSYLRATQQDTISLLVEGDGSINAGFLGRIQTSGMTFRALKEMLEKKVIASYPSSNPSLVIVSTGLFSVNIRGEVLSSQIFTAWGLTRLSEAVKGLATPYASLRDVIVRGRDGASKAYDLFKAERFGNLSQDPLLRPGDVIEVKKAERTVLIEGQVRRPGIYQMLPGEGVGELVRVYGDGTLVSAKTDTVVLTHKASAEKPASESIVFDLSGASLPALVDGDTVRVVSREEYLPVVYVEGAVHSGLYLFSDGGYILASTAEGTTAAGAQGAGTSAVNSNAAGNVPVASVVPQNTSGQGTAATEDVYGLVRIAFRQGQLASQVIKPLRSNLSAKADLKHAYILRGEERIDLDLEQLLFQYTEKNDIPLAAGDRIIIPYGYDSVYVQGEVLKSSIQKVTAGLRLADVLKDNLTALSSRRDIVVMSQDGKSHTYDVFKFERFGDVSQNPLLRPGDMIEVKKVERLVQVEGEIRKPGTYQLLPGEGVKELVSFYGDGTLVSAKTNMAVLTRKSSTEKPDGESIVFDVNGAGLPELVDGDKVRIPSQEEYLPVVYIEGAIVTEQSPTAYNVQRAVFRQGQTVYQVVKPLEAKLSSKADLRKAYIARGTERIFIDLEKLLHFYSKNDDIALQADDHIVIPFGLASASVKGEVKKSAIIEVVPGLRLSDALKDNLTPLSSQRDIAITSQDGKTGTFDLFKAERFGDLNQNPLLRPGDVIEVKRAERFVQIEGEVRRPGTYQLLAGEGVQELVRYYADGTLSSAKIDHLVLTRKASPDKPDSESLVFDLNGKEFPQLFDGDKVRVASQEEYLPVVYIEGAIAADQGSAAQTSAQGVESYNTQRAVFRKGLLVSQVMKPLEGKLSPKADLRKAYIARRVSRISVDLEKLLHFYSPQDDIELQPEDHIVIPYGLNYAYVRGEVKQSAAIEVTSQTRLSEVMKGFATGYSSLRDVRIMGLDGSVNEYDLFKADRFGDSSQNPFVRPGDIIEVKKAARLVYVQGEVRRPGTYQLLPGEGAKELVYYYGDGLLVSAKTDFVTLTRKASAEKPSSESIVFDISSNNLPQLLDGDTVRIASREEYLPIIYLEGAVQSGTVLVEKAPEPQPAESASGSETGSAGSATTTAPQASTQKDAYGLARVVYRQGQRVSQVVKAAQAQLSSRADLQHSYIIRGNERIAVDVEKLLYRYRIEDDVVLAEGDRIVIPFGYASVYVKGEVQKASVLEVYAGMRLSDAIQGNLTAFSSQRDIAVTSDDGKVGSYDLFKVSRTGDLSQDPLLRPGDVIEVKKAERIVKIEGEVRRPGAYQLLSGEGVKELVEYYGDGALASAKSDSVILTRKATAEKPASESVVFDLSGGALPVLVDGDSLRLPSREEYLPVVYVEGAVAGEKLAVAAGGSPNAVPTNYSVVRTPYRENITLSLLLRSIKEKILSSADLAQAFIIRKGEQDQIRVNLDQLLYANDLSQDITLKPQDRIVIPFGSMNVFVAGEVTKSSWVGITGLTRLSEVVAPLVTRYSSLRDVTVKSLSGVVKTYDLFKAERYGDISQNPFLEPGDEIRVRSLSMLVTIDGEVRRPGSYQLLPGEGLKELIEVYAQGFTEKANPQRLGLVRYVSESSPVGEKHELNYETNKDFKVHIYDVITVPSKQDLMPVIWFEGAVGLSSTGASPETSQRVPFTFFPGETLSQAALANRKLFSAVSDLSKAYIIRSDGTHIPVDISKFIYNFDLSGDIVLQQNDIIIVPFRQFFVSVSGAVRYPGRYPYIPDRTWEYYIGLAGGFDTERNGNQKITIYDVNSKKVDQANRMIQPEDNIVAASNSFTYQLMRISTILSTVLSLVAIIVNLTGLKL